MGGKLRCARGASSENSQADPQSGVLGLVPNWVGLRPSPGRVVEDKESKKNLGLRIFLPFRQIFLVLVFWHQSGSASTRIWHETRRKRINWKIVDCRQQEHRQRGGAYSALLIQRDFVRTTGTTQVRCQGWAEVLASYAASYYPRQEGPEAPQEQIVAVVET